MLGHQGGADGIEHRFVQLAHQLADELHLPPLALEIADALGLGHRFDQFVGQLQAGEQIGAQGEQIFAQFLQLGAFALEVGAGGLVGAFELGLVFQVQRAALRHELTFDEIAFF